MLLFSSTQGNPDLECYDRPIKIKYSRQLCHNEIKWRAILPRTSAMFSLDVQAF